MTAVLRNQTQIFRAIALLVLGIPICSFAQKFDATAIYKKARQAVVFISTPKGFGTGFFINKNGWLITNNHVIESEDEERTFTPKDIIVFDYSKKKYSVSEIKNVTNQDSLDIILLKVDLKTENFLPILPYDEAEVGERVVAIGHTKLSTWTQSEGSISNTEQYPNYLQIQTPTNHGNSGGPLINAKGQVVGVVTLTFQNYMENTNFAIKAGKLRRALDDHAIKYQTNPIILEGLSLSEKDEGQIDKDREQLNLDRETLETGTREKRF